MVSVSWHTRAWKSGVMPVPLSADLLLHVWGLSEPQSIQDSKDGHMILCRDFYIIVSVAALVKDLCRLGLRDIDSGSEDYTQEHGLTALAVPA